jgi:hypothetical protein
MQKVRCFCRVQDGVRVIERWMGGRKDGMDGWTDGCRREKTSGRGEFVCLETQSPKSM